MRHEVLDPALVVELGALSACSLVLEDDAEALRQERGLAQALNENVLLPLDLVEHLVIGHENDSGARLLRGPDRFEVGRRLAAGELLLPDLAVAADLHGEPLGERVHDRDTDPVQSPGDLVALAAELPSGVQLRQDDRNGRQSLIRHDVDRNARAVVSNGDRVVRMQQHLDEVGATRKSLVHRVVDHLEDEVVKAPRARRPDVHTGSQTDRFKALQNSDVFCGIRSFSH